MKISNAENSDCEKAAALTAQALLCPWIEEDIEAAAKSPGAVFLKAETEDGEVLGYALSRTVFAQADVEFIAVKEKCRGRGAGGALFKALLDKTAEKGADQIFLEVAEDNAPAIGLYEKNGFQRISVRKKYYKDKDAIIMRKKL